MTGDHWKKVEEFRRQFWKDAEGGSPRRRSEYLAEFSGLEAEIDAEISNYASSLESRGSDPIPSTAGPGDRQPGSAPQKDHFGRFELVKELGRGGQGRVFLARDTALGRDVALKILTTGGALSPRVRQRFKGEAEKAAKLDHPNVARVFEWGEDEGTPFIAMELVRGETLSTRIRESARTSPDNDEPSEVHLELGEEPTGREKAPSSSGSGTTGTIDRPGVMQVVELIESAARGLHEAHERGLVHRDIKPGNLMVTTDRGLVILDFGMAYDETSESPSLTATGDIIGTPAYMSPEQLAAKRVRVDRRSDVYSLGVTLFECLSLRRPFEAPSREALFQEIIARDAPDIRKLNPAVPADLAVVVGHALEKHPDRRYATALDFADDLRRVREGDSIVARPPGFVEKSLRRMRRRPVTSTVAVASLLLIIGLGSAWWWGESGIGDRQEALDATSTLTKDDKRSVEIEKLIAAWRAGKAIPDHSDVASIRAEIGEAERRIQGHETTVKAHPEYADALDRLRDTLRRLNADGGATEWIDAHIEELARTEANAAPWNSLIAELARKDQFRDLELEPIPGIHPLGADRKTGLQEFLHLASHDAAEDIPARDDEGRIAFTGSTGIILVLVPGGPFWMGAQSTDPEGENYDPDAKQENLEGPPRYVSLRPYLISKYEVSRGQWERLRGGDPSHFRPEPGMTLPESFDVRRLPVNRVSWNDGVEVLRKHGLDLPTEAQWECACRGAMKRRSPFTFDSDLSQRSRFANLKYEDGVDGIDEVHHLAGNVFGLHHLHGNLGEWCLEMPGSYQDAGFDDNDGYRLPRVLDDAESRVENPQMRQVVMMRAVRGGSFLSYPQNARSSFRNWARKDTAASNVGLRPVMNLPRAR
ncbi:MAG: bifunctional serine/threonine-protein kinase/formylglycine-generating enzyme family protein [Planctomycetota bacterium]